MILVVDDEPIIRDLMSAALGRAGYQIMVASNGQEALNLFQEHAAEIQLLISDVIMPSMDGISLANSCRQQNPQLPVLFMSGFINSADEADMAESSQFFIHKPIDFQKLFPIINKILG
jgi:two-component system cell cycle sensor histidine kinase/response regulator CckA